MATFLDVGLFSHFSVIFTFLFIFVIMYALLNAQKMIKMGDGEKGIYAIIALSVAFLSVMSGSAVTFVGFLAPWFTGFIIFLFFIFFVFRMWTGDDDSFFKEGIKNNGLRWTLIVASLLIFIAAASNTFGQSLLEDSPDYVEQPQTTTTNGVVVNGQEQVVVVDNTATASGQIIDNAQTPGATASDDFGGNVLATFVHPKILGLILMLLVAFFSILLLARSTDPNNQ